MSFSTINLVCHADWSINPRKRWAVIASLQGTHHGRIYPPVQVVDLSTFFAHLQSLLPRRGCILVGFDFPIGLPWYYAQKTGVTDFLATLPQFGQGEWQYFYDPAETPCEITLHRPFYPRRPGNSRRSHLEQGLGLPFEHLYRLCEKAHKNRYAACPLFWTLGGQQVGKAAILGWKHLLVPALVQPALQLKLWPFSGLLDDLCQPGHIVVVETYPAEFYGHLGIHMTSQRMSKRSQAGRRYYAASLLAWPGKLQLELDKALMNSIEDGFGDLAEGEDQFDALVGLYGMINVIKGNQPAGEPFPPQVSTIEGWIFGQERPERGF